MCTIDTTKKNLCPFIDRVHHVMRYYNNLLKMLTTFTQVFFRKGACGGSSRENLPENPRKIRSVFLYKHNFTELKSIFLFLGNVGKSREISGKFRGNFRNSENSRKISGEISPENFRKISGKLGWFFNKTQCYSAKTTSFIFIKAMKIQESFRKISGKILQIPKIPGRNFSGKFPGNSGCFFRWNAMLQSKNLFFYVYKR